MVFCALSTQLVETLIKVPNGGVSALLITKSSLSCGSNANSSARAVPPVLKELTIAVKLTLELNETTRLGLSVAKMQFPEAVTPLGPEVAVVPVSPANPG